MNYLVARAAVTAGLVLGSVGFAGIASAAQTEIGTPGTPNCQGQTTAYVAQFGKSVDAQGVGNVARFFGLSTKELKAEVDAYCAVP
jgi:hypothetical protein